MDDKELLELAAKAAGIRLKWERVIGETCDAEVPNWNPLDDDGEALRLAAKRKISIIYLDDYKGEGPSVVCGGCCEHVDTPEYAGDPSDVATRRAIVRAAAEIGKDTP